MTGGEHIEKTGKSHVEITMEKKEFQKFPLSLQKQVQELTKNLSEANASLRESESKYSNILESIEDGYFEVDLAGNMTFFNSALCRITGYSRDELHGMNHRDYTEPETAKRMFEIFNTVYRTGEAAKINDYEVIRKDGTKCIVELSTSLMHDPAGNAIGFRGVARDITERSLARKALEESEEKYRTILESIEEGYYEVDIRGNFVFFNEVMARTLGRTPEEIQGMNNRQYQSEKETKKIYKIFNEIYRTGQPVDRRQLVFPVPLPH